MNSIQDLAIYTVATADRAANINKPDQADKLTAFIEDAGESGNIFTVRKSDGTFLTAKSNGVLVTV